MSKSGIKVFAPASVANVAVGFDTLGFALEKPGDEILIRPGQQPGLVISEIRGAGGRLPHDPLKNTAGYAALRLLEYLGESQRPLEMVIHKKMPFGSGLGSSAASAAGAVYAVSEFLRTSLHKSELLRFAVEGEQIADGAFHADNVAPSLLGGMILIRDNQTLDFKKLHAPPGLYVAVVYPHTEVLTKDARSILSDTVPFDLAIRQQGNLAAFVAAIYTSDFDLLGRCMDDLLVEPQRAHLIPHFYDLKAKALAAGALGFSISGAGPSMFALCDNSLIAENVLDEARRLYAAQKIEVATYLSKINHEGAILF